MEQRPIAMALFSAGATIGAAIGMIVRGWICTEYGWCMAFLVMGLPGLLLAIVVRITIKEPPWGHAE